MSVRAGRRFLLAPARPIQVRPSSRYEAPPQMYARGEFAFGGQVVVPDVVALVESSEPASAVLHADLDIDLSPVPFGDFSFTPGGMIQTGQESPLRTDMNVVLQMPTPAIVMGRPILPKQGWMKGASTFTSADTSFVTTKPLPPVPAIVTRPDTPPVSSSGGYVWKASDLGSGNISTWPEEDGGPSFFSAAPYRPSVASRSVLTSKGRYTLYDKVAIFDYRNVEHMWMQMPNTLTGAFTWLICGIILSYPTARYGHYLLDHGHNPGSNGINYGFRKKVSGEGGHRSAMLFQRHSALVGTTYPTIEVGPYARCRHDYTPQPRMFYGVFDNAKGVVGVRGRNYRKHDSGRILDENHRNFVVGRRNGYTSTDLASHIAIFEIRFFPGRLSRKQMDRQYSYFYRTYDFAKYKI